MQHVDNIQQINFYDMEAIKNFFRNMIHEKVRMFTEKGNEINERHVPVEMQHYFDVWKLVNNVVLDSSVALDQYDFTFVGKAIVELNYLFTQLP